ncbi:MAG: YraN family protein [Candidatus Pacebacteria bacterium]|nr:YraN family protein [Candidatus Paceibacterota bacterium]
MPSDKRKLGDIGEGVVCRYLERRGYRVVERNYWKPWGEIDIVAEKGEKLCFIEVKSISHVTVGAIRPEENLHPGKMKRLSRVVQTYLVDRKIGEDRDWQIDLACVVLDLEARVGKVEYFENIVL